jgi:hypothetical protein
MGLDIIIGAVVVAVVCVIAYLATHRVPAAAVPNARNLSDTLAAAAAESWSALKADLPAIVSAEVAQLKADLAAALRRAQTAEADLAASIAAHNASLASVAARVAAAVTGSPELPPSPIAPAVAAAKAEDAAQVLAFADKITPAPQAL